MNCVMINFQSLKEVEILDKRPLGEGAFSFVYKVLHKQTNKIFALKKIDILQISKADCENLKLEIKLHKKFQNPYIIDFKGCIQRKNIVYMLLEHASNGSLFFYIDLEKGLPEILSLRFLYETALGLQYLHRNKIIHRDIKPENLLLDKNFKIKICDFGWSCKKEKKQVRSSICGTYEYMSPEIVYQQSHDFSVDVWCLGILLYEMLHGSPPFKADDLDQIKKEFMKQKIQVDPKFNSDIQNLILKLLDFDPRTRITVDDMLEHPVFKKNMKHIKRDLTQEEYKLLTKYYYMNSGGNHLSTHNSTYARELKRASMLSRAAHKSNGDDSFFQVSQISTEKKDGNVEYFGNFDKVDLPENMMNIKNNNFQPNKFMTPISKNPTDTKNIGQGNDFFPNKFLTPIETPSQLKSVFKKKKGGNIDDIKDYKPPKFLNNKSSPKEYKLEKSLQGAKKQAALQYFLKKNNLNSSNKTKSSSLKKKLNNLKNNKEIYGKLKLGNSRGKGNNKPNKLLINKKSPGRHLMRVNQSPRKNSAKLTKKFGPMRKLKEIQIQNRSLSLKNSQNELASMAFGKKFNTSKNKNSKYWSNPLKNLTFKQFQEKYNSPNPNSTARGRTLRKTPDKKKISSKKKKTHKRETSESIERFLDSRVIKASSSLPKFQNHFKQHKKKPSQQFTHKFPNLKSKNHNLTLKQFPTLHLINKKQKDHKYLFNTLKQNSLELSKNQQRFKSLKIKQKTKDNFDSINYKADETIPEELYLSNFQSILKQKQDSKNQIKSNVYKKLTSRKKDKQNRKKKDSPSKLVQRSQPGLSNTLVTSLQNNFEIKKIAKAQKLRKLYTSNHVLKEGSQNKSFSYVNNSVSNQTSSDLYYQSLYQFESLQSRLKNAKKIFIPPQTKINNIKTVDNNKHMVKNSNTIYQQKPEINIDISKTPKSFSQKLPVNKTKTVYLNNIDFKMEDSKKDQSASNKRQSIFLNYNFNKASSEDWKTVQLKEISKNIVKEEPNSNDNSIIMDQKKPIQRTKTFNFSNTPKEPVEKRNSEWIDRKVVLDDDILGKSKLSKIFEESYSGTHTRTGTNGTPKVPGKNDGQNKRLKDIEKSNRLYNAVEINKFVFQKKDLQKPKEMSVKVPKKSDEIHHNVIKRVVFINGVRQEKLILSKSNSTSERASTIKSTKRSDSFASSSNQNLHVIAASRNSENLRVSPIMYTRLKDAIVRKQKVPVRYVKSTQEVEIPKYPVSKEDFKKENSRTKWINFQPINNSNSTIKDNQKINQSDISSWTKVTNEKEYGGDSSFWNNQQNPNSQLITKDSSNLIYSKLNQNQVTTDKNYMSVGNHNSTKITIKKMNPQPENIKSLISKLQKINNDTHQKDDPRNTLDQVFTIKKEWKPAVKENKNLSFPQAKLFPNNNQYKFTKFEDSFVIGTSRSILPNAQLADAINESMNERSLQQNDSKRQSLLKPLRTHVKRKTTDISSLLIGSTANRYSLNNSRGIVKRPLLQDKDLTGPVGDRYSITGDPRNRVDSTEKGNYFRKINNWQNFNFEAKDEYFEKKNKSKRNRPQNILIKPQTTSFINAQNEKRSDSLPKTERAPLPNSINIKQLPGLKESNSLGRLHGRSGQYTLQNRQFKVQRKALQIETAPTSGTKKIISKRGKAQLRNMLHKSKPPSKSKLNRMVDEEGFVRYKLVMEDLSPKSNQRKITNSKSVNPNLTSNQHRKPSRSIWANNFKFLDRNSINHKHLVD